MVVTGSRLRGPNVIGSLQITNVAIEDISDRGITRVEDYLNDLPQISPGQAITASNGSTGTATVNVRNLGSDAGYRYADYSTGHSTNTYKLEAFWRVSDNVALSASYQSAIRHANLLDTDPQVSSDAGTAPGNGNTFPAFFDAFGRYVFVNLGVSF